MAFSTKVDRVDEYNLGYLSTTFNGLCWPFWALNSICQQYYHKSGRRPRTFPGDVTC